MDTPSVYDPNFSSRLQRLVKSKYGLWILGLISFVESALVVPIITDPFLIIYILANRSRVISGVIVTVLSSVVGGTAAYLVAYFFQSVVLFFIGDGHASEFYPLAERFREETFVLTILGAITPIPYTLVAMAAGFVKGNLFMFILASIIGRAIRYGIVGYITYRFGQQAIVHLRKHLIIISITTVVAVAGYWIFLS